MLDRIRPRAVLVGALLVIPAVLAAAIPASAAGLGGPSPSALASASPAASPVARAIGGPQLAARGVVVNYPPGTMPRLPNVAASAFVIADASTGQVLAAKDPHGWYRPASTLKVLTAVALIGRQALRLPVFLKYDQTMSARFVVARRKAVGLYNQNTLLTSYPGAVGGKIGWTSAAGATYVGMATRHRVTLIVTLLHCPALSEINSAKKLLDWGFAADGKVALVGTLVGPRQPPSASPASASPPSRVDVISRSHAAAASPSVLAAAGFSCAAVLAAVLGIMYSRRQRLRATGRPDCSARDRV